MPTITNAFSFINVDVYTSLLGYRKTFIKKTVQQIRKTVDDE